MASSRRERVQAGPPQTRPAPLSSALGLPERTISAPQRAGTPRAGGTRPSPPAEHRPGPPREAPPIQYVRGVGPARAGLLGRLGIRSVTDLLYRLPRRLEDRGHLRKIYDLPHGSVETVRGTIGRVEKFRPRRRRGLVLVRAAVTDGSGVLHAVWFNQPYLARQLPPGAEVILHGRVQRQAGEIQMAAPEFEVLEDGEETLHVGRIVPVYGSTEGLTQRTLRTIVARALDEHVPQLVEWLPPLLLRRHDLPTLGEALRQAHFPDTLASHEAARRRLVYEELLLFQLLLLRRKAAREAETRAIRYGDAAPLLARFHASLPYALTAAQRRVIGEILRDLEGPHPMNRLLQGDVGSGKTVVAATALLRCVGGGAQGALMAPTEILAGQHYLTLRALLEPLGLSVVLLVGGLSRASRQEALERVRDGRADVVVGTHALIEAEVAFDRLGLVVVDEQHRFGVAQRAALRRKGERPDVLVMTATPIPRTLALTLYGDLDVSTLDELPPGRAPVKTYTRPSGRRPQVYAFVRAQAAEGRQAYIVCPLVEESDKLQAEAATDLAARLGEGPLRGLRVGVLHGRMKVEERDRAMQALRAGAVDVLVATTVIEVGIDVPNATVMVIEDADRFGLSQLHQLRGRVGRGGHQSYCILVADPTTDEARARLEVMVETTDGFRIAQRDLEIRGVGEMIGLASRGGEERQQAGLRQHGLSDLRVADLVRDQAWLDRARQDAAAILGDDPDLRRIEHRGLARALEERFGAARVENVEVG
jgi:ATP-dependent DNA helicase RecG